MKRIAYAWLAIASLLATAPVSAVTIDNGIVLITQADALAGGVTPGDTPGFPVTISVGGSYRLASNLTVTTLVNGIEVRANEVTIDMAGFTLAGSGVGRNGITSFNRSMTVQNGTVRGFTLDGVRTIATQMTVDRMRIVANGRAGVLEFDGDEDVTDTNLVVTNSSIIDNGGNGIFCGGSCQIEGNTISKNLSEAIRVLGVGHVLGNLIYRNGDEGILGDGGYGNNTIIDHPRAVGGNMVPLLPNHCDNPC